MKKLFLLALIFFLLLNSSVRSEEKKLNLKDTLDNKTDFSDFMVNLHGFMPFPVIISEPALGNFGGALALIFLSPKKSSKDSEGFHFPDITAVGDDLWHTTGGAGFRYLLARLFKLRMGVDVAVGPDQFAYYFVFGHYWNG